MEDFSGKEMDFSNHFLELFDCQPPKICKFHCQRFLFMVLLGYCLGP